MKKIIVAVVLLYAGTIAAQETNKAANEKLKLALQYLKGDNQALNPAKALELFKECANAGDARAMNAIGNVYRGGMGVDTNYTEALWWFNRAADKKYAPAYYNLGLLYKYGNGVTMNYETAYGFFKRAAEQHYPSGLYGQGYMLYKGMGCQQDYVKSFAAFKEAANLGNRSSMYFVGICYRNGYGVKANADSATYWLLQAKAKGDERADGELAAKEPENAGVAGKLIANAEEAKKMAASAKLPLNQYKAIPNSMPASQVNGQYEGYLLRYDYSGKNLVDVFSLSLTLKSGDDNMIGGQWIENGLPPVPVHALLTKNGLLFSGMQYERTDHYSPVIPVKYNFEKATLQIINSNDAVFVMGSVNQFIPGAKEPEKPLQVVLMKKGNTDDKGEILFTNEDGSLQQMQEQLTAYPNPFTAVFNVEFTLEENCKVYTQLLMIDGKVVYTQPEAFLAKGKYMLPLQPNVAAGTYVVRLVYGSKTKSTVIVKQ